MKIINHIEPKYYPDKSEVDNIKREIVYRFGSLDNYARDILKCSYKTFWQKLNNKNGAYFSEMEYQELKRLLEIDFKLH